jgi:hypothetical protein
MSRERPTGIYRQQEERKLAANLAPADETSLDELLSLAKIRASTTSL